MHGVMAARAYQASAAHRSQRDRDADVFRRATAALRTADPNDPVAITKARADNRLLWSTVIDLLKDPANPLPDTLRGAIISVGLTVQRELDTPNPDHDFIIGINEQIAAGLARPH